MILGFYPGAGGSRYIRYLMGKEYSTSGKVYDEFPLTNSSMRYLNEKIPYPDLPTMLVHCVNIPRIKECFPGRPDVKILDMDLKLSLQREWAIVGVGRYLKNIKGASNPKHRLVDSAFATISYHCEYYRKYPMTMDHEFIINDVEFISTMQEELNLHKNPIFELAWDAYQQYGCQAPIIDLYENSGITNE